jgi:hypothetical protein
VNRESNTSGTEIIHRGAFWSPTYLQIAEAIDKYSVVID